MRALQLASPCHCCRSLSFSWLLVRKRVPVTRSVMAVPAATLVVATATILPIALFLHGPPPLELSTSAWAGIVGQGLLSTFLATVAWLIQRDARRQC